MKRISATTTFIILVIFSQQALGRSIKYALEDIGNFFSETFRIMRGRPSENSISKRLEEIEERLGFDIEDSISITDTEKLIEARFNPLKNKVIKEAFDKEDTEAFRTALFEYIRDNHLDSIIVLRWWDDQGFRNIVFPYLNMEHLSNPWNPELLLRWWDEAVSRGVENQLELFVEQGFKNANFYPKTYKQLSEGISNGHFRDRFIRTVFRAIREDREFASHAKQVIDNVIEKGRADRDW